MGICVRNKTQAGVLICDYYSNPVSQSGYYGFIDKLISAGGKWPIGSSKFTKATLQDLTYQQEIRVLPEVGGKGAPPLLVLYHYQFEKHDGYDLLLETDTKGKITYKFALPDPEGRSLFQKIREFILPSIW